MNHRNDLEERFTALARELGSRPGLAKAVLARDERSRVADPPPAPSGTSRVPPALGWAAALAATALVAVAIWLVSEPESHVDRMLEALESVQSVHVTGTTTRVVRHWPLEDPGAAEKIAGPVPVEGWYWTDPHGVPRSYERYGPVTRTRAGGESREYQQDVDLLYIYQGGFSKDRVREFAELAEHLTALESPGMVKRELGTRREDGVTLRGLEIRRGARTETVWWNTKTMLPVRVTEATAAADGETIESFIVFAYNEPVPADVVNYQPPQAKHVRHGGTGNNANDAWRQHVAAIGRQVDEEPWPGRVVVLPRAGGRRFSNSWTLPTPDGRYKVTPLCGRLDDFSTLGAFIRSQVAAGGPERYLASWRVPQELREIVLLHDVVYEADVPWQQWAQVVLNHFGLEYVDVEEEHTVWIAHHDPKSGKPSGPVEPPVPYIVEGGVEKRGLVKPGVGMRLAPVNLTTLFGDFNERQAADFLGRAIIIVDKTGLPAPPPFDKQVHGSWENYWENVVGPEYPMATDSPYFAGAESVQMARDWYRDEFGIIFKEETRPRTIHVVRRKAP